MEKTLENGKEKILSREEILAVISNFVENSTVVKQESDADGVFLLNTKIEGEKPGETVQYEYVRKGKFPGHSNSLETVIDIVYYKEGEAIGGNTIAQYNPETKKFHKLDENGNLENPIELRGEKTHTPEEPESIEQKNELKEQYAEDQNKRNELQEKLNSDNLDEIKPQILGKEADMRDIEKKLDDDN
jgi:hypothetical protein